MQSDIGRFYSEDSNYFCCLECHPWYCEDCDEYHCSWFDDKCPKTGERNSPKEHRDPKLIRIGE